MSTRPRGRVFRALLWVRVMALLARPTIRRKPAVRSVPRRDRTEPAAPPEDAWTAMRQDSVVWMAYASAARHLVRLLPPALLVFLPIGLLAAAALAVLVDGSAVVLNDDVALVGTPGLPVLVWSAVALAVSAAGQAIALPATVLLAAGRLTGEDVPTSAAMRAAARRWPATMTLTLVTGAALATALGVGVAILLWSGAQVTAYGVMAVLVLAAMPCLLAVAPLILEGWSVRGALARAYRLTSGSVLATTLTMLFGVLLFPALATRAAGWAASGVPVAPFAAASVLVPVTVPFQAAAIARMFLHRVVLREESDAFGEVVARLPDDGPRPARPVRVLAALLLPTLLYAGAARVNPLGWPEVSETAITANWPRDAQPGDERPEIGPRDLRFLQPGPDGRMIMLMDGIGRAKVLACSDSDCSRARLRWAEPDKILGYTAAGARLPDGRLVLSTWVRENGASDDDWRARLELRVCGATGCVPAPGGRPVTRMNPDDFSLPIGLLYRAVALAARPGGGLLIAQVHEVRRSEDHVDREALLITTCDDTSCTRPRTKQVATFPFTTYTREERGLLVAVDAAGRPTVLRFDLITGRTVLISCGDPACGETRTVTVQEGATLYHRWGGGAMALRPDGRPLIAYRDLGDGAIKLFDCLTRDCSRSTTAAVSDPGRNAGPALVLDRHGRALVAHQDLDRDRVLIAICEDGRCTSTPITPTRGGSGYEMAMTLDGRGRPVLVWVNDGPRDWDLTLTRPLTLR